jgi:bifunctional UDP-N-acetylglucosamine pyrophosphorylase / glucosamine-1-phosphate N-acetyltransferase
MESLGVVVLAAGLGKRMCSAQAKVLHHLGGKPLIQHVLRVAQTLCPERLVIVVGHQADEVQEACRDNGVRFAQQQKQRGTGDAVRAAEKSLAGFAGNVLILCGDVPLLTPATLSRLVHCHQDTKAVLSLLTVSLDDPAGYGRIIRGGDGQVRKIVEDRDASAQEKQLKEINPGIFCARHHFLFSALQRLQTNNAQGEYYLTDIVSMAVESGYPVQTVLVADPFEVTGVNSREDLALMEKTLQERIRSRWMAVGVTLEDPDTVYIDEEVVIDKDTVIGPNTHLKGRTVIGEGCRIDGSAYITNCRLGNRVHVFFSTVLSDSELGDEAEVGPFAHLRGGTQLAAEATIGNFVEVKKSTIGEHTKAKHLAYIGDAEVGRETNIGAGTITCNYDGFHKYRTKIGDRVQVGSDSTLIAPVTLGNDVYVATATTIRKDVPAGALVFNERREQVREGWTTAKRAKEAAKKEAD